MALAATSQYSTMALQPQLTNHMLRKYLLQSNKCASFTFLLYFDARENVSVCSSLMKYSVTLFLFITTDVIWFDKSLQLVE